MKSVTITKEAANILLTSVFDQTGNECAGCEKIVIPDTWGGMISVDGVPRIYHDSLPCIIQMLSAEQVKQDKERGFIWI